MSITIYGFLGNELENIQERLINKFKALEFEIVLAPNTNLIFGVPDGLLNVKINRTPKNLRRISANTALAIQVDFHITPRANVTECDGEWPPDGVGDYTYEIFSRSASGRTNAHYYIQALIVVILASLTKGYSFFDDQDNACTGEDAVEGLIRSLNALVR